MKFIRRNFVEIMFIIIAIFIELFSLQYTDTKSYLTKPLLPLILLGLCVAIVYWIKPKTMKIIVSNVILMVQLGVNIGFIFLYHSNQTIFEWSMVNQRNDAYATIENLELQWNLVIIGIIIIVVNIILNFFILRKQDIKFLTKKKSIINCLIVLTLFFIVGVLPVIEVDLQSSDMYDNIIYKKSANKYQDVGMTTNALREFVIGKFCSYVDTSNLSEVEEYIYQEQCEKSPYFGISENNNLIMLLVESFELYPFTLSGEYASVIYPNISKFLNEGLFCENFYNREKTDTAEALSILGSYPTGNFINYDFDDNEYPFSLPNVLNQDNTLTSRSFHNSYGGFYNRYDVHKKFGFEQLYAIDEMEEYGVYDYWKYKLGERNLDSEMIDKMKEVMFPSDERFFSYIITFTMHGFYGTRKNLEKHYKLLDKYSLFPLTDKVSDEYLRTYAAALMEFDAALGVMFTYLEENNLLENTTIVAFSDHNTYYNSLSEYGKGIDEKFNSELYHIPAMIYDTKLTEQYRKDNQTTKITKFTTTSDIPVTIMDLFGVTANKNMYFGNSFFNETETICYSRAYAMFVDPNFVGSSLNKIFWKSPTFSDEYLKEYEQRAIEHVQKLEYIDKIYYSNYFETHEYNYN